MKIITYNVNGLRAAVGKGLPEWLAQEQPDVLCLQETNQNNIQPKHLKHLATKHGFSVHRRKATAESQS